MGKLLVPINNSSRQIDSQTAKPIRILLINTLYFPYAVGGAERSVRELAEELVELGHTVCVLTLQSKESSLPKSEFINGVRLERISLNKAWPFGPDWQSVSPLMKAAWHIGDDVLYNAAKKTRAIIDDFRPDVVNTHNIAGFGTSVWTEVKSIPLVHTIRDYYLTCVRTTRYSSGANCQQTCADCSILTRLRKERTRFPDAFVGVSQRVLEIHANLGVIQPAKHRQVIYNSPGDAKVDIAVHSEELRSFRQQYPFVFGFMGRIESAKGLPVILEALRTIDRPDLGLIVAGSFNAGERLMIESLVESLPNVFVAGRMSTAEYFSVIDASVVPSQWEEPFGRVAMEAMDRQIPVIASNIGGLPEVLEGYDQGILIDRVSHVGSWAVAMADVSAAGRLNDTELNSPAPSTMSVVTSVGKQYELLFRRVVSAR